MVSLGAVAVAMAAALTPKGLVETSIGQHAASYLVRLQLALSYFKIFEDRGWGGGGGVKLAAHVRMSVHEPV